MTSCKNPPYSGNSYRQYQHFPIVGELLCYDCLITGVVFCRFNFHDKVYDQLKGLGMTERQQILWSDDMIRTYFRSVVDEENEET